MKKLQGYLWNFRKTIGYLLFKKIFFTYILFVLIFTSFQIYREYTFAKNIVLKDMINVEKSFKTILSKTVWFFNEEKIEDQIKAIIDSNNIDGIVILTPFNEIVTKKGIIHNEYKKIDKYVFEEKEYNVTYDLELQSHNFDLIDIENSPNEILGTVTLFIKNNKITELAQEAISLIVINVLVSALVLWLLFIYYANKILTIPLNQMIEATNDFKLNEVTELKINLNTEKKHELNTLADTFNQMAKRVNEVYINLKQLTMIQEKQKHDLKNANKYKTDFLANMSHELKTPLNSINVISSIMMKNKDNSLSSKQVHNLKIINNCGNDLLFLINDVLDLSKLEAGELNLDFKQVDFYQLLLDIKHMFDYQIDDKSINFIFECSKDIGDVYTDDNRVKQIIKNLLSNAIKFVDKKGTIKFIVKENNKNIIIYVQDDGIGIEKEKLDHIFDRFKQADSSTTRKYGGTGLGLAICKELLILLKGHIEVKSKVGEGTIFKVNIPKNEEKIIIKDYASNINKKDYFLLLNNDPIGFFSLSVELKKIYELKQFNSFDDLYEVTKNSDDFAYVLIDITSVNNAQLNKMLSTINKKLILVSNEEIPEHIKSKVCFLINKPINIKEFLDQINKD